MPFQSWREAAGNLKGLTTATAVQLQLAKVVGLDIPRSTPAIIAAAQLRQGAAVHLGLPSAQDPWDWQLEVIEELSAELEETATAAPESAEVAMATIEHLRCRMREHALQQLQLEAGDLVEFRADDRPGTYEVSSIGMWGRVYFRGGRASAWPDEIDVLARADTQGKVANAARRAAANLRELERGRVQTSVETLQALERWRVHSMPQRREAEELLAIVETAADEKPIQRYLTDPEHRHLLAALLGGNHRWVRDEVGLGGSYRADFIIGEEDSLGIRWLLVELETPRSPIVLKSKQHFDEHARDGINQIRTWRRWLQAYLQVARAPVEADGVGLTGIHPSPPGLVLVGRRSLLRNRHAELREDLESRERIHVHTYDWLVEQLLAIARYGGPPGFSPYRLDIDPFEPMEGLP